MKPLCAPAFAFVAIVTVSVRGGPGEAAIVAAMRLSEEANYSWSSTVTDDAGTYDFEGKTDHSGYTWARMPMIPSIAQRLGREAEPEIEAFFRGCDTAVIRTAEGWRSLEELPRKHRDWNDEDWQPVAVIPRGSSTSDPFGGMGPFSPPPVVIYRPSRVAKNRQVYSNAQFGVSHPHTELAVIVGSHAELRVDGDVVSGVLTDAGAQLLLVRDGQEHIAPLKAAGLFKLLIKDGRVVKYLLRLEGLLEIDGKKVVVRQTSITTIKDVGKTGFFVPEEAWRKIRG